jgi:hypothetical protein
MAVVGKGCNKNGKKTTKAALASKASLVCGRAEDEVGAEGASRRQLKTMTDGCRRRI